MLQQHLKTPGRLLEIGSGTGQHAAWLPAFLPGIAWQPSDRADNLPGIRAWLEDAGGDIRAPVELDVRGGWPDGNFDYIFTANTFHIMDTDAVRRCIEQASARLTENGLFLVYGPFCYERRCSDSNARFDQMLRERDPAMGLRDYEWIAQLMAVAGLDPEADHAMPANNRFLVFRLAGC